MSKLSETLDYIIAESNLSNKEFAATIGISASCISEYVRNEKLPTVANLVKIADYAHCATDFLLGREQENPNLTFKTCPPFSERIAFLMRYFNCTATQIVHGAHIPKSRFYEWLNGKRQPALDGVIRLADYLHCRVDFVLGREA